MYNIGILDDELTAAVINKNVIEAYLKSKNVAYKFFLFQEEKEMFDHLRTKEMLNVIFLDIFIGDSASGIKIAKKINRKYQRINIVFLTAYLEYAIEVYETKHCYNILKKDLERRLPFVFNNIKNRQKYKKIILNNSGKKHIYKQEEILYIERILRVTKVYLADGSSPCVVDTLDKVMEKLDPFVFVRCHNSYIISFAAVKELRRSNVKLVDGTELTISRRYINEVREKFADWAQSI